jgi:hypothetical protein
MDQQSQEDREGQDERECFQELEAICHAYIEEALRVHADIFEELCPEVGKLRPEEFIGMADNHIDELACRLKLRIRRLAGRAR